MTVERTKPDQRQPWACPEHPASGAASTAAQECAADFTLISNGREGQLIGKCSPTSAALVGSQRRMDWRGTSPGNRREGVRPFWSPCTVGDDEEKISRVAEVHGLT